MYQYHCTIERVVDGDTVDAAIDLGFSIIYRTRVRLFGLNAPEVHGETKLAGLQAKEKLTTWLSTGVPIMIHTNLDKRGKFGRVLGTFFVGASNINQRLIDEGYAVPYMLK